MERELVLHPQEPGLLINLAGLEKRMRVLEAQFAEFTNRDLLDLCDYRLIDARGEYPVSAVGAVLINFQQMVTVFLDAIRTGPKVKARISAEIAQSASMNFAYSFPSSLGFMMTVPNERLIAIDSDLDIAIEKAFQVVNARETSDIAILAKEIGVASIRSAYAWAKQHAKYGLSADIKWKRGDEIRNHTLVEASQLDRVATLIEQTSDTTEEAMTLGGVLDGLQRGRRTFTFIPTAGSEIQGKVSDSMGFEPPFEVPSTMTVRVVKRTKIHYSIEKEETTWELVGRVLTDDTST